MPAEILKISVLANGDVLLDGAAITLLELEKAIRGAPAGATVWYYRENPGGQAPAVVEQVMKLITANRLPVRLSTQPDFSDASAPAAPALQQAFTKIRETAAQRKVVIV